MEYFDSNRADRMVEFIETLKVPEGMHVGKPLVLRDWQKPIIRDVYGPVDRDGKRFARKAIYSVGKKNGKSPIVASICLGHLFGPEASQNQQIYSAAFDREQASLIFRYMRQIIEMDEELSQIANIKTAVKEIENTLSGSVYKALSSEARSKHGIAPALLVFDELAQFGQDREFYDTLIQGMGAHEEGLVWIISTQAADDQAVLSQEIDYALSDIGQHDPTVRCFLFTTPEDMRIDDPESWKLSNPALGDFLSEKDMENSAKMAMAMPTAEMAFRNLRLNQRVALTQRAIPPEIWRKNSGDPDKEALSRGRIFAGLDLSGKNDLTALIFNALYDGIHNIFPYFWTPGDTLRDRAHYDKVPYDTWADKGFLEAKPGKTIDYRYVAKKVYSLHRQYGIYELRFDRYRIDDFIRELRDLGCECYIKDKEEPPSDDALCLVNHGQGYKDMGKAVEWMEDILAEENLRHGNHPVLTMCASNAITTQDPAGSKKFDKQKANGRIDGIVALAMALNGAELPEEDREPARSRYEKEDAEVFAI